MSKLLIKSARLYKGNFQNFNSKLRFLKTQPSTPKINRLTTQLVFDSEDVKAYNLVFPTILDMIREKSKTLPDVTQRNETILKRLLPHTMVMEGQKIQALYKTMEPPEKQTEEKHALARILGWSIDFMISSIQINDDIFEESDSRWDYTCLYKQEDVKLLAVNDAVLLENLSHLILKEFCSNYPWYTSSIELLHTVSVNTALGQTMEHILYKFDKQSNFEHYNFKKYNKYAEYVSTYCGIMLPAMFATYCSGDYDDRLPKKAEDIFIELGIFKKMQDDIVDREEDIPIGAFSWPVVQAIAKASPGQKKLIGQHYGKSNPQSILLIQNLFDDLEINRLYEKRKNKSFDYVCEKTKNANIRESHKRLFYKLIEILYEIKIN